MGYTIYWYREKSVDSATFEKILQDFRTIRPELYRNGILLADPSGDSSPMINNDAVGFNGKCASQGCCEPFSFKRELIFTYREPRKRDGKYFQYVKTDGLPYGLAAETFLIIAKHHLKERIKVSSDNPVGMWDKPRNWCQHILGYGGDFLPENNSAGNFRE